MASCVPFALSPLENVIFFLIYVYFLCVIFPNDKAEKKNGNVINSCAVGRFAYSFKLGQLKLGQRLKLFIYLIIVLSVSVCRFW